LFSGYAADTCSYAECSIALLRILVPGVMAKKNKSKSSGGVPRGNGGKNSRSSSSLSSSTTTSTPKLVSGIGIVVALAYSYFSASSSPSPLASASIHSQTLPTDPWVDIVPSVIPPKTCNDIIYKSEREIGYRLFPDSIDKNEPNNLDQSAQEIYIYHKEKVVEQSLYDLIEPHLPKLTEAIRRRGQRVAEAGSQFGNMTCFAEPKIEWIFLRKYFPLGRYSKRNSLKVHTDSNMHSITLALNDDYKGGGLMVVRPRVSNDDENTTKANDWESLNDDNHLHMPQIPVEYGGYQWLHEHKDLSRRVNSSKVFFPELKQGSAALINFTVPHGVAPLEEDSSMPRYALIVFYNIDAYYDTVFPLIEEFQSSREESVAA